MLRGEFIRADGLVIPNNITQFGAKTILGAAYAAEAPRFFVGLVEAAPSSTLQIENCAEPTIGVGGYARQEIPRTAVGWPVQGDVNGEPYIESRWLTWEASADYSRSIRRLMLLAGDSDTLTDITGPVMALSAALPAPLIVKPATILQERRFKYRVYLR